MWKSIQHAKWPLDLFRDLLPYHETNLIFEQLKVVLWKSVYLSAYLTVSSVRFYICIQLWNITLFKIENISMTLKVPPPHTALGNHCSVFFHYGFVFSGISYTWNHTLCTLLFLACFAQCKLLIFFHVV